MYRCCFKDCSHMFAHHTAKFVFAVEPLVIRNNELSVREVRQLLESGQVQNIVISPGPGTPNTPSDIGVCVCRCV